MKCLIFIIIIYSLNNNKKKARKMKKTVLHYYRETFYCSKTVCVRSKSKRKENKKFKKLGIKTRLRIKTHQTQVIRLGVSTIFKK